jgi:hypothetical protein
MLKHYHARRDEGRQPKGRIPQISARSIRRFAQLAPALCPSGSCRLTAWNHCTNFFAGDFRNFRKRYANQG